MPGSARCTFSTCMELARRAPGARKYFRRRSAGFLKDCTAPAAPVGRDYADAGEFANGAEPPAFEFMGRPVWRSKEEWSASDPFVDHYVLQRSDGGPIVVDEINWWPLVFPLKCRAIMTGETRLAGPNATLLEFMLAGRASGPVQPGPVQGLHLDQPAGGAETENRPAPGSAFQSLVEDEHPRLGILRCHDGGGFHARPFPGRDAAAISQVGEIQREWIRNQ